MNKMFKFIFVTFYFSYVMAFRHQVPLPKTLWQDHCTKHSRVLNDCNWCWCNERSKYSCTARMCQDVDMFGHFKDSIKELHVGMEGHGAWRAIQSFCEPGVHYQRSDLLCVCTEDGTWPNPVCRDTFRVLHPVKVYDDTIPAYQVCEPTKLYVINCNVCFCPTIGKIDPQYCTKKVCTDNDPVIRQTNEIVNDEHDIAEVYAQCNPDRHYKIGCKTCLCLRNNRLLCDNCTESAICNSKKTGVFFAMDCNTCYCDKNRELFCTVKKCLNETKEDKMENNTFTLVPKPVQDLACTPGTKYKKGCNICYCYQKDDIKKVGCTLNMCSDPKSKDCVEGTTYSINCQICQCLMKNGIKVQICQEDPKCAVSILRTGNHLNALEGTCQPNHIYKIKCNTCQCMLDGRTLACTNDECEKEEPVSVDIVPVFQEITKCPRGYSYKIDCNYCFCLDNGNAMCTTMDCKSNR